MVKNDFEVINMFKYFSFLSTSPHGFHINKIKGKKFSLTYLMKQGTVSRTTSFISYKLHILVLTFPFPHKYPLFLQVSRFFNPSTLSLMQFKSLLLNSLYLTLCHRMLGTMFLNNLILNNMKVFDLKFYFIKEILEVFKFINSVN